MALWARMAAQAANDTQKDGAGEGISDHALMAVVAQGDAHAFSLLIERHLKAMVGVSTRLLGNAFEADEVVQEGFLRLWRYAPEWKADGTASVKTWLTRVVSNLCIDRLRRRRTVPLEEAGDVEDIGPGVFEQLAMEDRKRIATWLLNALPERQKEAVVLTYFQEMSAKEAAAAMELTDGAVESLLVRAKRNMREMMTKQGLTWEETI